MMTTTMLNSLEARDTAAPLHSYANPKVLAETGPVVIERGEGIYVFDNTGKRYVEGVAALKMARYDFKANIRSGVAMVNLPTAGIDFHVPLSGMRSSAYGQPEMGHHAMRFYTKVRTAYTFAG